MTTTFVPTSTDTTTWVRVCGIACLVAGLAGAGAGMALALVEPAVPVERFSYPLSSGDFAVTQAFFFVHHLGLLAGLVGLGLTGAVPKNRAGRWGLRGAVAGMVGLTVTELAAISAADSDVDSPLGVTMGAAYGVVCLVLGVSLVVLGVAIGRAGAWTGWRRWVVLVMGVWVFVPMFPALAVATDGARLAIAAWMLLFAVLAAALLSDRSDGAPAAPAA
jgi:hypothetical protein